MKAKLLSLILSICTLANVQAQIDISVARGMNIDDVVTVKGIVTNGPEFGVIRYIQDLTGGIGIYDPGLPSWDRGDSVILTGKLADFSNLLEISTITSHTILSTGNTLPTPLLITPLGMNESVESQLVQIDNVLFDNGGATFAGNTNYGFSSGGETGEIRITGGTDIEGTLIPISAVSVVALQSQFSFTYQLLPRDLLDIIQIATIFLTSSVDISAITKTSVDLSWSTNLSSNTT
ncbi:MAG: hypothetical protein JKX73_01635, partial [Flavobacteriales bacterium]|nr:hypothetical protein [Flavobacteriales bacterium]